MRIRAAGALVLIVIGTAAGPMARAGEPDLSSPKAAAASLYQAMQAQDEQAILKIFYAPQKADRDLAQAYADLIVAGKKLADAAKEKYGAANEAIGAGTIGVEGLAQLDRAEVKSTGDTATLTIPGQTKTVTFHRTGDRWQIVLSDFAGTAEGGTSRQVVLLKKVSEALSDTAAEIQAGKCPTAQAAEASIQGKLARVMIRAATQASTRPATKP